MGFLNIILILLSSYVLTNMDSDDKVRYFLTVGVTNSYNKFIEIYKNL